MKGLLTRLSSDKRNVKRRRKSSKSGFQQFGTRKHSMYFAKVSHSIGSTFNTYSAPHHLQHPSRKNPIKPSSQTNFPTQTAYATFPLHKSPLKVKKSQRHSPSLNPRLHIINLRCPMATRREVLSVRAEPHRTNDGSVHEGV